MALEGVKNRVVVDIRKESTTFVHLAACLLASRDEGSVRIAEQYAKEESFIINRT